MQESWLACGGSTSVGVTALRLRVEKSRSRATGASNTTRFGVLHVGGRRLTISAHHCIDSSISCGGVTCRRTALDHHSAIPSAAAAHAVIESVKAISSNDGTHPVAMSSLQFWVKRSGNRLRTLATAKDSTHAS